MRTFWGACLVHGIGGGYLVDTLRVHCALRDCLEEQISMILLPGALKLRPKRQAQVAQARHPSLEST